MATTARSDVGESAGQRILGGVFGGIVGGLVFGAMMGMMGMLAMIANIVGSDSAGVGFLYHMFNSALIGAIYGLVLGNLSRTYGRGAGLGLLYGAIWWVLGPLVLMPLMMGMGGAQFGMALSPPMLMSLVGHLIFGLLTGVAYVAYAHARGGRHA
ncbi:MAG: hypothetical protein M3Q49_19310 [Actinomycetota bacterium]|nr:hypothetical protein [Actinomycetota bacterium]